MRAKQFLINFEIDISLNQWKWRRLRGIDNSSFSCHFMLPNWKTHAIHTSPRAGIIKVSFDDLGLPDTPLVLSNAIKLEL